MESGDLPTVVSNQEPESMDVSLPLAATSKEVVREMSDPAWPPVDGSSVVGTWAMTVPVSR